MDLFATQFVALSFATDSAEKSVEFSIVTNF